LGALGDVVELTQPKSVGGELVEVRGFDLAAVGTDVGESEVIGHDQYDVGPVGGEDASGGKADGEGEEAEKEKTHGRVK